MRALSLSLLALLAACNGGNDTDTDSDSDTGDTDSDTLADPGDLAFTSYDEAGCATSDTVVRGETDTEDGHWSATRIEPGQAMRINEVRIHLFHDPLDTALDCEANAPTTVAVWVTDASTPPADATPTATLDVPQADIGETERVLRLTTDIEVGADESVYVAIQMVATATSATCVRTCADAAGAADNFWSNSDTRPYDWSSFDSFGLQTTQFMSIHGEAL